MMINVSVRGNLTNLTECECKDKPLLISVFPKYSIPQPLWQTCLHQEGSLSAATREQPQVSTDQ